jgi:serine-type D-Ala-D-Ala carboxypeptidase (penicillin-binding protein 5/6)
MGAGGLVVSGSFTVRRRPERRLLAVALSICLTAALGTALPADAQRAALSYKPQAPYRAAVLADASTGEILRAQDERVPWPSASLVKMMTVLVAIESVQAGKTTLEDQVLVSAHASKMGGSQVYLAEGERFPLRELLAATMIHSANDAAAAVAEHTAGSTEAFVARMNERAKELGMEDSEFHSVHGLPPARDQKPDLMSGRDLVILARELTRHAEVMEWAKTREAPFRNGAFGMHNPNKLLWRLPDAVGLKTGYFGAAGFNVTAMARRNGLELVAVVLGSPSSALRFDNAVKLLEEGFADYKMLAPVRAGDAVGPQISISGGREGFLVGVASEDVRMRLPRAEAAQTKVEVRVPTQVVAPLKKGQKLGEVVVTRGTEAIAAVDVVSPRDVESTSWWQSLLR